MKKSLDNKTLVETFEELLAGLVAAHGHLCPGQIVGVRMAMWACASWISRRNPHNRN